MLYYDGRRESIALVMGDVEMGEDVICPGSFGLRFRTRFQQVSMAMLQRKWKRRKKQFKKRAKA